MFSSQSSLVYYPGTHACLHHTRGELTRQGVVVCVCVCVGGAHSRTHRMWVKPGAHIWQQRRHLQPSSLQQEGRGTH